ncbi:hypothetical protein EDC04DRAFT_2607918 [Pisolithus marmoratus]|nr:hypothetical protein EDC04DRAFT_2607918 [Pisolithus marmoratus]
MSGSDSLTLSDVKASSSHFLTSLPPYFPPSATPNLLMSPPSKKNFSTFSPCNELEDGKKDVPDTMMHTFRAGDEVIVQGEKGVIWYGVIKEIRIQHLKTIYVQKAWVAVQWYYGKWDITNKNIQNDVGKCELVLSDHIDIVSPQHITSHGWLAPVDVMKFMEGEGCGPFIASDDVFTQWSMKTTETQVLETGPTKLLLCLEDLPKGNKEMQMMVTKLSMESGLSLDNDFARILCISISRGKGHGVVGNGNIMIPMWKEFWTALEQMKQDMGMAWKSHITPDLCKQAGESHVHYQCPVCSKEGRGWYL